MQNTKLLIGVILGTLILVVGVAVVFSKPAKTVTYDSQVVIGDERHATSSGQLSGAVASGSAQVVTKAVVVEFSDFQCPACRAANPVVEQIINNAGGVVELVYRDFPLESLHKNSKAAAIAAEAAGSLGKFWPYHEMLFEKQPDWAEESDPTPKFVEYAKQVGLGEEGFRTAMESQEVVNLVQKDISDGNALGVNATPTFFVDGEKVGLDQLANVLQTKIESN